MSKPRRRRPKTLRELMAPAPPFIVYFLSRHGHWKGKTLDEKVKLSGLPLKTFCRIANRIDWDEVKFRTADAFIRGCGVDVLNFNQQRKYLIQTFRRKRFFVHIKHKRQREKLLQLCRRWRIARGNNNVTISI